MDQNDGALRRRHHSDENVLIMPGAQVVGNVTFTGPECSVWHNAVIRGGPEGITIGRRTNIQDCAVLHTDDGAPCTVGEDVTIGHGAVVHACTVGDRVLIGMGAVVLTGAVIGSDCLVGAGALVTGKSVIPPGSMVLGSPARAVRPLTGAERASLVRSAEEYAALKERYREEETT